MDPADPKFMAGLFLAGFIAGGVFVWFVAVFVWLRPLQARFDQECTRRTENFNRATAAEGKLREAELRHAELVAEGKSKNRAIARWSRRCDSLIQTNRILASGDTRRKRKSKPDAPTPPAEGETPPATT